MCFSNFHSRFGIMQVFLNFGVYYEGQENIEKQKGRRQEKKEEDMKQMNSSLSFTELSSIRLQKFVFLMWRHYNYERMRRGADFYLLQSNSTYVNIWTAVQRNLDSPAALLPQEALQERTSRGRQTPLLTNSRPATVSSPFIT
ncbi:hypothetical protein ABG768_018545 [Culter alburnus]|uniref:Uncharacterized protein n=1 Tax=Culter alburnus TaxID=194366 RepID=A0AAW1YW10_CULAL